MQFILSTVILEYAQLSLAGCATAEPWPYMLGYQGMAASSRDGLLDLSLIMNSLLEFEFAVYNCSCKLHRIVSLGILI